MIQSIVNHIVDDVRNHKIGLYDMPIIREIKKITIPVKKTTIEYI